MCEVYHARDARLGRDVAMKVLPEALAKDTDRSMPKPRSWYYILPGASLSLPCCGRLAQSLSAKSR